MDENNYIFYLLPFHNPLEFLWEIFKKSCLKWGGVVIVSFFKKVKFSLKMGGVVIKGGLVIKRSSVLFMLLYFRK